jgi:hypothetical protein
VPARNHPAGQASAGGQAPGTSRWSPPGRSRSPGRSKVRLPSMSGPCPAVTLSDTGGRGERAQCRRYTSERDLHVLLRGRADLDDLPPKCACRRSGTGRCHLSYPQPDGRRPGGAPGQAFAQRAPQRADPVIASDAAGHEPDRISAFGDGARVVFRLDRCVAVVADRKAEPPGVVLAGHPVRPAGPGSARRRSPARPARRPPRGRSGPCRGRPPCGPVPRPGARRTAPTRRARSRALMMAAAPPAARTAAPSHKRPGGHRPVQHHHPGLMRQHLTHRRRDTEPGPVPRATGASKSAARPGPAAARTPPRTAC